MTFYEYLSLLGLLYFYQTLNQWARVFRRDLIGQMILLFSLLVYSKSQRSFEAILLWDFYQNGRIDPTTDELSLAAIEKVIIIF